MWGGDALPRMMYDRASSPRKGWNTQGEIEDVYLEDGMGFQGDETHNAIQYLKSANLLILDLNGDGDRYEKFSVDKGMQQYLKPQVRDLYLLKTRSLMLMCHLFPGSKEIEPLYVILVYGSTYNALNFSASTRIWVDCSFDPFSV